MNSIITIIDARPVRNSLIRFSVRASHSDVIYDIVVDVIEHYHYDGEMNIINLDTVISEITEKINSMHLAAETAMNIMKEGLSWEVTTDESLPTTTES